MLDRLDRPDFALGDLLSIEKAATSLPGHLTVEVLRTACRAGRLAHIRDGRKRLVTQKWLDEWCERERAALDEMPPVDAMTVGEPGFIYFVGFGPYVKIGYAGFGVQGRVTGLQTSCPEKLTVYATVRGYIEQEGALHRRYAKYRTYGEWFRLEGAVRDFIEKIRGKPIDEERQ